MSVLRRDIFKWRARLATLLLFTLTIQSAHASLAEFYDSLLYQQLTITRNSNVFDKLSPSHKIEIIDENYVLVRQLQIEFTNSQAVLLEKGETEIDLILIGLGTITGGSGVGLYSLYKFGKDYFTQRSKINVIRSKIDDYKRSLTELPKNSSRARSIAEHLLPREEQALAREVRIAAYKRNLAVGITAFCALLVYVGTQVIDRATVPDLTIKLDPQEQEEYGKFLAELSSELGALRQQFEIP